MNFMDISITDIVAFPYETKKSVAWKGTLLVNGEAAAKARNTGNGEPTTFLPLGQHGQHLVEAARQHYLSLRRLDASVPLERQQQQPSLNWEVDRIAIEQLFVIPKRMKMPLFEQKAAEILTKEDGIPREEKLKMIERKQSFIRQITGNRPRGQHP
jgi:hypothetical protein